MDKRGKDKFLSCLEFRRDVTVSLTKPNRDYKNRFLNNVKNIERVIIDGK